MCHISYSITKHSWPKSHEHCVHRIRKCLTYERCEISYVHSYKEGKKFTDPHDKGEDTFGCAEHHQDTAFNKDIVKVKDYPTYHLV